MNKIYFLALTFLLLGNITPVFACGGEDEEACAEAQSDSDAFQPTPTKENFDSESVKNPVHGEYLYKLNDSHFITDFARCKNIKATECNKGHGLSKEDSTDQIQGQLKRHDPDEHRTLPIQHSNHNRDAE
jgi:hypothetical protein